MVLSRPTAPAVSPPQSFHSVGEDYDEHTKKNSFISAVVTRRQLQQDLHSHRLATQTAKSVCQDPAMVTPSPS
ncbi:hypothetical protein Pst134EA_032572 [Puccinia striiformis f. sp. tritici]|uniref:uncharacterized protein n=1 Tax=Puccinia striiformis f. sp. tritici TaxID=168172 RepID=UPI002008EAA1|nr:uncharacterized protein Pst134EA_032572 [Puccinia striiformis f. sp. tritici]KAH9443581.1 hypothetical protein Pst134EA_032572 [Puccinia striiformis f. sp. tritici]